MVDNVWYSNLPKRHQGKLAPHCHCVSGNWESFYFKPVFGKHELHFPYLNMEVLIFVLVH